MTPNDFAVQRQKMVDEQMAARGIRNPRVLEAMRSVPRHEFVIPEALEWAYADAPVSIGHGQTISQPYIVALMTELLRLKGGECVLDVGTGSGYQAAVLSRLADEVHTIEVIPELAISAEATFKRLGYRNIHIHVGDGSCGWAEAAPYAGIVVAAAAPSVPPPLLDQLDEGGRLVIPIGSAGYQQLEVWTCQGQDFKREVSLAVAFVPLRGEYGWK